MALNNIIRRVSSSKVVPLAIRMAGGSQSYHHHCSAVLSAANRVGLCSGSILKCSVPLALRRYSTKLAKDESLIQILDEEIESAEGDEGVQASDIPKNFPFEIEDNPGQNTITLSRDYQGETIVVEVDMPSFVTDEKVEDENNNDHDEDNNVQDEDNDDDQDNSSQLPLVVKISRNKGQTLEFACTAYPDEISIDGLSLKDPDSSEDQIPYEGPDFLDLDENLQKAFHKYLEIRGIKPSTTNFLHEYMINKDSREYLLWLGKINKFVQH